MHNELPNTAQGLIHLMPSTQDQVNSFANKVIQSVKFDGENPLHLLIQIRAMEKAFKIITEKIQQNALTEADKYPEKKFEFLGNEIEKAEVGTAYNYAVCCDHEWERYSVDERTAAEQRKQREVFLRALKEPLDVYDKETGETWTIKPPTKTSTSSLKVYIK